MGRVGGPLVWLGALLAIYLIAPIAAFAVRLMQGAPSAPGLGGALVTSLVTATISAAIIAVLGIPLAYALARARGKVASALSVLVALPLALPPLMSGILLLYLVGPYTFLGRLFGGNLTDTRTGIVIAQTFVAAPFLVIAARGAFRGVEPDLEDVARTLGHGRVARFMKVSLPVAWPGVQAGLLLAWLRSFGEFGATVILAYHPYSLPVFTFVQFDSTGLDSTMLPVAAALAAALVVLAAVQLHGHRGRAHALLPAPVAPHHEPAAALQFSLSKRLGTFELALEHEASSPRLALLGPSGSGKTLTLKLLAGITEPDRAEIHAGAQPLGDLRAEQRKIGYLPQHSALLPRKTVWEQVNFAIDADPALAAWWLEQLDLGGLEDRFPDELSGGQQRRVALARALARGPSLILLDEPFSALDSPVRARLYRQLRRLQHQTGLATVLVTHDPEEAALLADDIIVLEDGSPIQQGPTSEVFAHPASPTVAGLLGIPNTYTGTIVRPGRIESAGVQLAAPTGSLAAGRHITWAVRPEDLLISAGGGYRATVLDAVTIGAVHEITVTIESLQLTIRTTGDPSLTPGSDARIDIPAETITLWPSQADNQSPPGARQADDPRAVVHVTVEGTDTRR
jgi:ABC-type sulfate/molybdate transport systems ATPase subunit/ABC-type sulfate transport system permease component